MTINKNASRTIKGKNSQVFPNRPEASMEIPIVSGTPNFDHFLEPFKQYFSNPQYRNLTHYLLGLVLCEGKRTLTRLSRSHAICESYNRLHHFISESPWAEDEVNNERIQIMKQHVESMAAKTHEPIGFFIGDDTTNPKTGTKMAGFGWNHSTVHDAVIPSQSIVTTFYQFQDFGFPFYPSLYKSEAYCQEHPDEIFKTKNDLLIEQILKAPLPENLRTIGLFDAFYFNQQVLTACQKRRIEAIGRLKENRRAILSSGDPVGTRLDSWFDFLRRPKQHPFKQITIRDNQGTKRQLWMFHWTGFIKNLGLVQLVILSERIRGKNLTPVFIATTDLNLSAEQIIGFYFKRWAIETFFWTAKERLGFNDYQVRPETSAKRHWLLCFLAHSYLVMTRHGSPSKKGKTLGDYQRLEQQENFRRLIAEIHSKIKERGLSINTIYYELTA